MQVTQFNLEGLLLLEPKVFRDERGFFCERFKAHELKAAGISQDFVQDNFSISKANVLRGLHFQWNKPQGKLVTCTSGKIFDVAVDIRKDSKTFGQHIGIELSGEKPQWLWVPAGFAHGFCVLGETDAHVLYKVDQLYSPEGEGGIVWNDADLNVKWPKDTYDVSPRDVGQKTFSHYKNSPFF